MNEPQDQERRGIGPNWSVVNQCLLWLGLAAAVAWLFFRHNEHLLSLAPFLFLLGCPLMHLFGHGGHGGHGGREHETQARRDDRDPPGHVH